ncbi:TcpK family conjugal transfer DNA-binding protein, partial [Clostridium perfringens]
EYDTAENKLHMWRELKWLIADDEKLVKRVRIDDERVYAIVIDYSIFSWLKIQMEV